MSQNINNINFFRSPIGIPISLSGNFGELRSNHFHTGLDIKPMGLLIIEFMLLIVDMFPELISLIGAMVKQFMLVIQMVIQVFYAHLDHFPEKIEKIIRKNNMK